MPFRLVSKVIAACAGLAVLLAGAPASAQVAGAGADASPGGTAWWEEPGDLTFGTTAPGDDSLSGLLAPPAAGVGDPVPAPFGSGVMDPSALDAADVTYGVDESLGSLPVFGLPADTGWSELLGGSAGGSFSWATLPGLAPAGTLPGAGGTLRPSWMSPPPPPVPDGGAEAPVAAGPGEGAGTFAVAGPGAPPACRSTMQQQVGGDHVRILIDGMSWASDRGSWTITYRYQVGEGADWVPERTTFQTVKRPHQMFDMWAIRVDPVTHRPILSPDGQHTILSRLTCVVPAGPAAPAGPTAPAGTTPVSGQVGVARWQGPTGDLDQLLARYGGRLPGVDPAVATAQLPVCAPGATSRRNELGEHIRIGSHEGRLSWNVQLHPGTTGLRLYPEAETLHVGVFTDGAAGRWTTDDWRAGPWGVLDVPAGRRATIAVVAQFDVTPNSGGNPSIGQALDQLAIDSLPMHGFECRMPEAGAGADPVDPTPAAGCDLNSFTAGTGVLLADGGHRPIEQLRVGDQVLAGDPVTGRTAARPVTHLITGEGEKQLVDLTIDGRTLTATGEHPFYLPDRDRWVDAQDLQPGDRLSTPAGGRATVDAARHRTATAAVHNLTVAGLHTYYVRAGDQAVLVHNGCPPRLYPGGPSSPAFEEDMTECARRGDWDCVWWGFKQFELGFFAGMPHAAGHLNRFLHKRGDILYDDRLPFRYRWQDRRPGWVQHDRGTQVHSDRIRRRLVALAREAAAAGRPAGRVEIDEWTTVRPESPDVKMAIGDFNLRGRAAYRVGPDGTLTLDLEFEFHDRYDWDPANGVVSDRLAHLLARRGMAAEFDVRGLWHETAQHPF